MRNMLSLALMLSLAGAAAATDLGNQAPVKVPGVYPINIPNPVRQGGDTVANATVIPALPYNDSGTTAGYTHDYTATCFSNATAPDVVYRLVVPASGGPLRISLCGSSYDTGLIVYDASMTQVGCNDDFCSLQSEITTQPVTPGATYYIIVTGYSGASGAYTLLVGDLPCAFPVVCPGDPDQHEGEPTLYDNYVDRFNGGCNSSPEYPFQHIPGALMPGSTIPEGTNVLCGVSGWYLNAGANTRDTDWHTLTVGPAGTIEIIANAEYATYIFELAGDCTNVSVAQQATAGPCVEAVMTISANPGSTKWFWVGPTVFVSPDGNREYDYVVWFDGLQPEVIPTEAVSWGAVKMLYD